MQINYYTENQGAINVSEFAFSAPDGVRKIGPYVRNTYLLHIVTKGVCHFCDFDVYEGSAFIIAKNKLHSFSVEPEYSHFWFAFDGEGVLEEFLNSGIPGDRHSLFEINNFEYVKELLELVLKYPDPQVVNSALRNIFSLLKTKENATYSDSNIANLAKTFILNNYQSEITIEDVARHLYVCEKYLYKKFREKFGVSPQQYLMCYRMKQAKTLLKTTDLKIKEISASVGYKSQLTFSYAFKRYVGVSPSEYRCAF